MNNLSAGLLTLLMLNFALSMSIGVNLKRWYGWVQVLSFFLVGVVIGNNAAEKIIIGLFFALMTIWLGPIVWRRRHP